MSKRVDGSGTCIATLSRRRYENLFKFSDREALISTKNWLLLFCTQHPAK